MLDAAGRGPAASPRLPSKATTILWSLACISLWTSWSGKKVQSSLGNGSITLGMCALVRYH